MELVRIDKKLAYILGVIFIIGLIILGSLDLSIYILHRKRFETNCVYELPTNANDFYGTNFTYDGSNLTQFTFGISIDLSSWWHSSFTGMTPMGELRIEQQCPTTTNDVILFLNDQMIAMTERSFLSSVVNTAIQDCNGRTISWVETGALGINVTVTGNSDNGEAIGLAVLSGDKTQRNGYIIGNHLFDTQIGQQYTLHDNLTNNAVAQLSTKFEDLWLAWNINIIDSRSPAANWGKS